MALQYVGLNEINGSLVVLDHVKGASYDEMVEIQLKDGTTRSGRVVQIEGEKIVVQVFEGTNDLSLENTKTKLLGRPMELPVSKEILGRVFNGAGRPIDGLGEIYAEEMMDINGLPLNPVSRVYPRNYINTGISSIDCLATLIRGQKLPIFSGSGLPHDRLAVQIVKQAKVADESGKGFAIVFAAMGVTNDVANYFKRSFKEAGVMERVVMFLNLSNDPIIERILTPRCALTAAEYLAFKQNMHVLVIYTDVTSYCEALREFSSSKGEIPGRKGYPGYLYSDLASLYERAGIIKDAEGSVTQIPILTMPNNDITHPVPDLTGYITEGQITLDVDLNSAGVYPPVGVLPSLSRLMKDGMHPQAACEKAVNMFDLELKERRGQAGDMSLVAMNNKGEWGVATNIEGFSFAVATADQEPIVYLTENKDGKCIHTVASQEWLDNYMATRTAPLEEK